MVVTAKNLSFLLILLVFNQFKSSTAVVNGDEVKNFKEWGFMVQIWTKSDKFLHAGIILNEGAVMTVATKLQSYASGRFAEVEIVGGRSTVDSIPKSEDRYSIYGILLHPDFLKYFTSPQYNIAIIKLQRLFSFKSKSSSIFPSPVTRRATPTRYSCRIAGWGSTNASDSDGKNHLLYQARVNMIAPKTCLINAPKLLCGSKIPSNAASCTGDEGGPLICFDPEIDKHSYVHGIIWRCEMNCDSTPGIFISLYHHRKWIEHTLELMKKDKMFQDSIA